FTASSVSARLRCLHSYVDVDRSSIFLELALLLRGAREIRHDVFSRILRDLELARHLPTRTNTQRGRQDRHRRRKQISLAPSRNRQGPLCRGSVATQYVPVPGQRTESAHNAH